MQFDDAWAQLYPQIKDEGTERIAHMFFELGKTVAMERAAGIKDEALEAAISELLGRHSGNA